MKPKIDAINATILSELLQDGRKSFVEISNLCHTSKDVIAKRYKQMQSKGIIVGATIQNSCICYGADLLAGISVYTQPDKAEQTLKLCREIPQIFGAYHIGVNPSLFATALIKNIQELDDVKQSIKKLPFVSGVETSIWTGLKNTPENLSILKQKTLSRIDDKKPPRPKATERRTVDETDRKIIEKLAANARIPFMEIAKEIGVSTDTVTRRYEKLKRNGDLKVIIQINPLKIGYYAYARMSLSFISHDNSDTIEKLAKITDVNNVIKTSGKFDFRLSLMLKDIQQLTNVQEQIVSLPGTTTMEVAVEKLFEVWPLPREFISTL